MNKFDKPYRIQKTVDSKKNLELFDLVLKLDTHEISQFALNNQISLDITNEMGNSLVHEVINIDSRLATEHSKLNVIKFLYSNNADIDKPNKNNQTPLHLACSLQLKLIVNFLIDNNADINFKDNSGSNPLCYLLTGKYTSVDIYDVTEFIPHPKKVDFKLKEETIILKKKVWNLIQRPNIRRVLPMLETIKRTIDSIIIEDDEINSIQISTNNLITDLASQKELENNIPRIRDKIFENKNFIRRKINNLFQNFRDLDNLIIHPKTETSWSPLPEHNNSALIIDGEIKRVIKRDIENCQITVNNLKSAFALMDTVSTMWNENGFEQMATDYINLINEKRQLNNNNNLNFVREAPVGQTIYFRFNGTIQPGAIDDIHQKFKHPLALDNASSIIDFKNLKYVGGPRQIELLYDAPSIGAAPNQRPDYIRELNNMMINYVNEEEIILYLLSSPLSQARINAIVIAINASANANNAAKLNTLITEIMQEGNFRNGTINALTGQFNAIGTYNALYSNDMRFYVILAYTAIFLPSEFDNIDNRINNYLNPSAPPAPAINPPVDRLNLNFLRKWINCYKYEHIGSWLIEMYCDVMCKFSQSNLVCEIPFRLLSLAGGLNNFGHDKIQGILNVYKPQLINQINGLTYANGAPIPEDIKIRAWIILLLNDNIDDDGDFFTDIFYNSDLNQAVGRLDNNLQDLDNLLGNYLYHNATHIVALNNNLYQRYYKSDDITENICTIILEIYKGLKNKPMKQTILDTIYYFKQIDRSNVNVSFNDFLNISTLELFFNNNYDKFAPSGTTRQNYEKIQNQIQNLNYNVQPPALAIIRQNHIDLNRNHFQIAHILGLHYQGLFENVNYFPNKFIQQQNGNNTERYAITFVQPPPAQQPGLNHRLAAPYNILMPNNVELPLKYIILSNQGVNQRDYLQPASKYYYYDIHNRPYISPTIYSYAHMLLKNINDYQKEVSDLVDKVNSIVGEIVNARTSRIKNLYINLYPEIVMKNQILDGYIQSFNEFNQLVSNNQYWQTSILRRGYSTKNIYQVNQLATSLNELNANYYLYYYIYSPENLVKLSKFNYYQIPIDRSSKIEYFINDNEELVDIKNELDPDDPLGQRPRPRLRPRPPQPTPNLLNNYYLIPYGRYNSMLVQYFSNNSYIYKPPNQNDFIKYKSSKLPPSLHNNLDKFYKCVLIELIKRLLKEIETNRLNPSLYQEILNQATKITKSRGLISNDNNNLSNYLLISKIIQELAKEQINVYINDYVDKNFYGTINGLRNQYPTTELFLNMKQLSVNLEKISDNTRQLNNELLFKNMYSNVLSSKMNQNIFIKYPNDLTNINKYRSKYGVEINEDIIKIMINKGASLYDNDNEDLPPYYPIIKNYNWKLVRLLKQDYDVDFRDDVDASQNLQINFIKIENLNNLQKVLGNYDFKDPVKLVLSNIDENLYLDVEMSIKLNQTFGNNILSNLKYSFNLSTYLTLQILSECLLNVNNSFNYNDLDLLLKMFNMDIDDINSNYWSKVTDQLEIPDDFNHIIIKQILDEKTEEQKKLLSEINIIDDAFIKINQNNPTLAQNYENKIRPKYKSLRKEYNSKTNDINNLNGLLSNKVNLTNNNMPNNPDLDTIDRYNFIIDYSNIDFEVWKGIFEKPINFNNTDNFNLLLIYIFKKQYDLIDKFNINNKPNLELIEKAMELLANFAENYFLTPKYTEKNIGLEYANKMLIYLTKMTIGTNIELIIRRILFTYLTESSSESNIRKKVRHINNRIDYYLTSELITDSEGNNQSLSSYLYEVVCPKLVINSVEIFKDKKEEAAFELQTTREILLSYFSFMEVIPLSEEIIEHLRKEVTNYFDTITSKTILLWYVNFENMLKYIINNHRCLKTFLEML